MLPHPDDTIVALSSAPGGGARAIVRLSGPGALRIVLAVFVPAEEMLPDQRRLTAGKMLLPGVCAPMPAELYFFPAPRTYTGQELVELHTLGSPPLVELLIAELLQAGARAAQPGEFTLRAFLAGKLDLPRAEAVLGVIEAGNRTDLRQALAQLAGGITRPLDGLRDDLLNLLADLEAGLDFADENIQFIDRDQSLLRISKGLAQLTLLQKQLDQRSTSGRPFRAVLVGRPNAGKSSLFNALTGSQALVSAAPGTTRDYLVQRLQLDGVAIELVDTAGWQESVDSIDTQAQHLGRTEAAEADLRLLCVEAGEELTKTEQELLYQSAPPTLLLKTKCDVTPADVTQAGPLGAGLNTSAVTGTGLAELRAVLAERARVHAQPSLAPSLSRCRGHVAACLNHLRRAHEMTLFEEPPELLALEIRLALDQLGEMVGAVYTDDLLDRIFSRFCIGK
ncbi:tRNA modification GTPase TrmE [Planctomycetaceae bacterium SCGC AG-212-F19]|nr:tRNA modification GTPase TrmE [Planctomycetaceae bacterium SCGC AG-212-F19]